MQRSWNNIHSHLFLLEIKLGKKLATVNNYLKLKNQNLKVVET